MLKVIGVKFAKNEAETQRRLFRGAQSVISWLLMKKCGFVFTKCSTRPSIHNALEQLHRPEDPNSVGLGGGKSLYKIQATVAYSSYVAMEPKQMRLDMIATAVASPSRARKILLQELLLIIPDEPSCEHQRKGHSRS